MTTKMSPTNTSDVSQPVSLPDEIDVLEAATRTTVKFDLGAVESVQLLRTKVGAFEVLVDYTPKVFVRGHVRVDGDKVKLNRKYEVVKTNPHAHSIHINVGGDAKRVKFVKGDTEFTIEH